MYDVGDHLESISIRTGGCDWSTEAIDKGYLGVTGSTLESINTLVSATNAECALEALVGSISTHGEPFNNTENHLAHACQKSAVHAASEQHFIPR